MCETRLIRVLHFSVARQHLSVEINRLLTINKSGPGRLIAKQKQGKLFAVSMIFVVSIALSVALGLIEVWMLKVIAQEISRQNRRKRVRAERQKVTTARRLWTVGCVEDR